MNATLGPAVRMFLFACAPLAAALAQEKPATPAATAPTLATSTQGQAKAPVDIVVVLRHSPPRDGKCDQGANACDAADHWLVELQPAGGKPVLLTLQQEAELQKDLKSAASPKATGKLESVTLSAATLSMRVPANTPYARVQSLMSNVARSGIHQIEYAVMAADKATELRLPVPIPTDTGSFVIAENAAAATIEEIRIALHWDKARGEAVRQFGKTALKQGAEGDAQLRSMITDAHEGWRKLGKPETPGVIDAASGVPWEAVVQAIDAFRAAGVQDVQFATGHPKPK